MHLNWSPEHSGSNGEYQRGDLRSERLHRRCDGSRGSDRRSSQVHGCFTMTQGDVIEGRVAWIFEDHFDVDLIVGVENIKSSDPDYLRQYCMKAYDSNFVADVQPGDVLVGGRNFGYGHPHYPPMIAMRALGITCIIADSFSPGFRRGELSNGMVLLACPDFSSRVRRWERLRIEWRRGVIERSDLGEILQCPPPTAHEQSLVDAGGLFPLLQARAVHGRGSDMR